MAETYPWGPQAPTKRVDALKRQIATNEQKRTDQIEAHRKRIVEIDETERQLKKDLAAAQAVVDREHREAMSSAAARMMEKVLAGSGADISEALKTGEFEKLLAEALGKVGTSAPKRRSEKQAPAPAPAPSRDDTTSRRDDEVPPAGKEAPPSGDGSASDPDGDAGASGAGSADSFQSGDSGGGE